MTMTSEPGYGPAEAMWELSHIAGELGDIVTELQRSDCDGVLTVMLELLGHVNQAIIWIDDMVPDA